MSKLKNANLEQRLAIKAERNRLPCLNRNISISKVKPTETEQQKQKKETQEKKFKEISTAHKKSAFALEQNVKAFIEHFGLNHCGFLTLTFADNVQDPKEAQRRFNSLRTNFLKKHYPHYIRVIERTKSGRIHYHLIVACKEDIRRGLNFQAIERKDYRTANNDIKRHWKRLRENLPKYGFGRAELLPVKTNSKGLAAYISKYIGKHINQRTAADKSVRLCQTSIDKTHKWKIANSHFQFLSKGSKNWRKKLEAWAGKLNEYMKTTKPYSSITNQPYTEITAENWNTRIKQVLKTEKWAFFNLNTILNTPIPAMA